jgi:hypothetical protein
LDKGQSVREIQQGRPMAFNAKVKKTDELFEATNEEHSVSNVHVLEDGKTYCGNLYKGKFDPIKSTDGYTVFRCTEKERTPAKFSAEELQQIKIPLKIRAKREKRG